jgi:hypothetical protein
MSRPGDRLRALAARLFDARTMERLVDPVVADLQAEHGDAVRAGRRRTSGWIRIAGYIAFLKVATLCAWAAATGPQSRPDGDRSALWRAIGLSLVTVTLMTVFLHAPSVVVASVREPSARWLMLYMIPQSLPFTIPMALTLGTVYGLRSRVLSRRLVLSVVVLAMVCSAASFATVFWVAPAANRAYSVSVAQLTGADAPTAVKEPGELTLGEHRRQIQSPVVGDAAARRNARGMEFYYYSRWALSSAPIVLTLLGLSIVACRSMGRVAVGVLACSAFLNYYVLLYGGRAMTLGGPLPTYIGAWLPNVILILISGAVAMMAAASHRAARSRLRPY